MLNEQGRVLLFRRAMSFFSRTSAPGSGRILRAEVTVERPDATVLSNGMAAADFDTCPPCRPKLSPKQAAQMGSSLRNGGLAVQGSGGCLLIVRQEHGRLGGAHIPPEPSDLAVEADHPGGWGDPEGDSKRSIKKFQIVAVLLTVFMGGATAFAGQTGPRCTQRTAPLLPR
jgi:hypothetical protein